nr:hypothetical protein [uncultured Sphingomonas sp.]
MILAFVGLNYRPAPDEFQGGKAMSTFDVSETSEQADSADDAKSPAPARPTPPRPVPKIILKKVPVPERTVDLPIIPMDKKTLDLADIGKLGSNASDYKLKQGGAAAGDSERVGTAPNGEPLYAAEWYRKPTNQELSAYLPKNMPEEGGAGLIACRTADQYRVEDCVELGSYPAGSHLGGAVRQAAWQFKVRPPRVGGKPLLGTWVRIRIDYLPPK